MKRLILAIVFILLFVAPCSAGLKSSCKTEVVTEVSVKNETSTNYGWVGIQSIKTVIDSPDGLTTVLLEVSKYDEQGVPVLSRKTISGPLATIISENTVYDGLRAQKMNPNDSYSVSVYTPIVDKDPDITYIVTIKIARLISRSSSRYGVGWNLRSMNTYYTPTGQIIAIKRNGFSIGPGLFLEQSPNY